MIRDTRAWDLLQEEVHDLRSFLACADGAHMLVEEGALDARQALDMIHAYAEKVLKARSTRFERVMRPRLEVAA